MKRNAPTLHPGNVIEQLSGAVVDDATRQKGGIVERSQGSQFDQRFGRKVEYFRRLIEMKRESPDLAAIVLVSAGEIYPNVSVSNILRRRDPCMRPQPVRFTARLENQAAFSPSGTHL